MNICNRRKKGEVYIDTAIKIIISAILGFFMMWGFTAIFGQTFLDVPIQSLKGRYNYSSDKLTYHENVTDLALNVLGTVTGNPNPSPAEYHKAESPDVPTSPLNPKASQSGNNIIVSWAPPFDDGGAAITSYYIAVNGTKVTEVEGNTLGATISGKTTGSSKIAITAVNSAGESAPALISLNMDPLKPDAPKNLQGSVSNNQVTLTWEKPNNDGGSPITEYCIYKEDKLVQTSKTLTAVLPNIASGDYLFKVTAKNSVGEGDPVWTWLTVSTIPGSPASVSAARESTGMLKVNWTAPGNDGGSTIIGYNIYLNGQKQNDVPVNSLSYEVKQQAGKTYTVAVTALNAIGESAQTTFSGN